MLARDVMTRNPITIAPDASVEDCARRLLEHRISALPVTDSAGHVLGIVSEGDLIRRREVGTARHPSWWLELVSDPRALAQDYVKSAGHKVSDVMTRQVLSVSEDTPLGAVAETLERRRIKRVPVIREGKLVGIVSRADLVRALLAQRPAPTAASDQDIREQFLAALGRQPWGPRNFVNIVVANGAVELWGFASSEEEVKAITLLAEEIPGVRSVANKLRVGPHASFLF